MQRSNTYIIIFTLITTVIVGGTLALTSIALGPRQAKSIELDTKSQILGAVMTLGKEDDVLSIYSKRIKSVVVDFQGNEIKTDAKGNPLLADKINVAKNYKLKPEERQLPVFMFMDAADTTQVDAYVLPVYGNGLWDRIWGYVALDNTVQSIAGISFGHKAETPGLGARIADDPVISERYKDKRIFDMNGILVSVSMVKGEQGTPLDEHHVDGMSGATMTGKGVNNMLMDYLKCYEAYFKKVKPAAVAAIQ